jgi:hypothetical protein
MIQEQSLSKDQVIELLTNIGQSHLLNNISTSTEAEVTAFVDQVGIITYCR